MWARVALALFVAYLAATAVHVGYVVAHEPFAFDAWNVAFDTHAQPITLDRFFAYWFDQYAHSNPRFGQPLTYLTYKLDYFAEVATPIAFLAISLAVTVLGLGRWPKQRRDLALWSFAIGALWFVLPEIGRNMFCRAYSANYIYGAAIQLWFLVPLRLAAERYDNASPRACVAYGVMGVIAGACNEHTGPTLVFLLAIYAWQRRGRAEPMKLVWSGFVGYLVGFGAIFFAPGQDTRYEGLATKVSMPMRVVQKGFAGTFDIIRDYVIYAAPLLGLLVVILLVAIRDKPEDRIRAARQGSLRLVAVALIAGLLMAATMFVSPKLGSRFYIFSMALLLAGFVSVIDTFVVRQRALVVLVLLAVTASIYAGARTIPIYRTAARQGAVRMAKLAATRPGDVFTADAFAQVDESWWYIGDDFRDVRKREMVAKYFGLARVSYRQYDPKAPLGLVGVRIAPKYWRRGDTDPRQDEAFDLAISRGFDIPWMLETTAASIGILRRTEPALDKVELRVEFTGARPPLPREHLLLARWTPQGLVGHAGSTTRVSWSAIGVTLPAELTEKPREVYVIRVGDEPQRIGLTTDPAVRYSPWGPGVYWVLVCDGAECWVVAATRQYT